MAYSKCQQTSIMYILWRGVTVRIGCCWKLWSSVFDWSQCTVCMLQKANQHWRLVARSFLYAGESKPALETRRSLLSVCCRKQTSTGDSSLLLEAEVKLSQRSVKMSLTPTARPAKLLKTEAEPIHTTARIADTLSCRSYCLSHSGCKTPYQYYTCYRADFQLHK